MLITYYGHSLFQLETAEGHVIVMDPYDASVGYPMGRLQGDVVTVSHEHHDHNNLSLVGGEPAVLRGEGKFEPLPGLRVTGYASFHDDQQGTKRGLNTIFAVEADGLRVLHLGDLGHLLPPEECGRIGRADVLLVPVGGFYTIDAAQAEKLRNDLGARITIPMHYKAEETARLPIAPVDDFLQLAGATPSPMPLLRVTKEDLSQQPKIALLSIKRMTAPFI